MYISHLKLESFRNFRELELDFDPGFNIIHGDNAQGKTNLVEALFFLAFLKSFRTNRLKELIRFDAEIAKIHAELNYEQSLYDVQIAIEEKRRKIILDTQNVHKLTDYLGLMRVSLFEPKDVALLQASPGERRIFLDRMVFNHRPLIIQDLDAYQKLIKLKSKVLNLENQDKALISVYDQQLEAPTKRILQARINYLQGVFEIINEVFQTIFDEKFIINIIYKCSGLQKNLQMNRPVDFENNVWPSYLNALCRVREQEFARKQCICGPHRDDWIVEINGQNARSYASQGQQRALILAFKMAEIAYLQTKFAIAPMLILDDVSSELDRERNRRLLKYLEQVSAQVFLTTTSLQHFEYPKKIKSFRVQKAKVTED